MKPRPPPVNALYAFGLFVGLLWSVALAACSTSTLFDDAPNARWKEITRATAWCTLVFALLIALVVIVVHRDSA